MVLDELTNKTFQEKVINSDDVHIVVMGAPWCSPCQYLKRMLEDYSTRIDGYYVNVSDYPDMAKIYDVKQLPQTLIIIGGIVKHRVIGAKIDQIGRLISDCDKAINN